MPNRDGWQSRIKAVEREYLVLRQASDRFVEQATADPRIIRGNWKRGELDVASRKLEGTYVIRLFAEFETAIRQYWATIRHTEVPTHQLVESISARRKIPDMHRLNGQSVRDYRNSLVHEREDRIDPIPIALARRYLCTFFSYLPDRW